MGWFRRVMDYVLGYEVEEIIEKDGKKVSKKKVIERPGKESKVPKKKPLVQQPSFHELKEKGEVQARVSYQYPQGKFRFPLISDEELMEERRPIRAEGPENIEEGVPLRPSFRHEYGQEEKRNHYRQRSMLEEKQNYYPQRSMPEEKQNYYPQRGVLEERQISSVQRGMHEERQISSLQRNIQEERRFSSSQQNGREEKQAYYSPRVLQKSDREELTRTRPFRPTEVPSPIYGFRQRPDSRPEEQHDEPIEFELPSSSSLRVFTGSQSSSHVLSAGVQMTANSKETADKYEELMSPLRPKSSSAHSMYDEHFERIEPIRQGEQTDERKQYIEQEQRNSDQSAEIIPKMEEKPAAAEEAQKVEVRPLVEEKPHVEPAAATEEAQRIEVGPAAIPVVNDTQPVEVSAVTEMEQGLEEREPIKQIEEKSLKESMALSEERLEKSSSSSMSSAESSNMEQQKRPHRPAVPFNVMMLKKDRQRLAEKTSSQQPSQGVANVADNKGVLKGGAEQRNSVAATFSKQERTEDAKEAVPLEQTVPSSPLLTERKEGIYEFPSMSLLNIPEHEKEDDHQWLEEQRELLDMTLKNFNVRAKVVNVTQGPTVTRFEVHPEPGVKVNKITNLTDDIKLSLAARDIRIEAPIPGKNTIGIEVPNRESKAVLLQEILSTPAFQEHPSPLSVALGLDISGTPIVTDLKKMPHGLIAGATGSGKSVCINTIIVSLLYKASPHQVKLMLIDPKMVELAPYNGIPHLVSPVITDAKAATAALKWAVEEMERRYELFAHTGVRDITKYNEKVEQHQEKSGELPYLVIIIDELADLMMVSPGEVEEAICRIAQKARACGIHLLLATQRPSVDVITGLIKANVPTRVAFSVSSQVDSRTIIDSAGAEKLLGRGDMLLLENGSSKSVRVQGNFVSDEEIDAVVAHVKGQMKPNYLFEQNDLIQRQQQFSSEEDELFYEACEFVLSQGGASTSSVQRHFRIGYNRAARLIDMMEGQGIISEARGSKPRDVLITEDELIELQSVGSSF
ncbi:MAG TPA: DNA translocase FtsK [Bacillus sp. (in: firmicutes)]|nr:DNA translocase FtsK [Bacillus sp. (in: firmicutes)]